MNAPCAFMPIDLNAAQHIIPRCSYRVRHRILLAQCMFAAFQKDRDVRRLKQGRHGARMTWLQGLERR